MLGRFVIVLYDLHSIYPSKHRNLVEKRIIDENCSSFSSFSCITAFSISTKLDCKINQLSNTHCSVGKTFLVLQSFLCKAFVKEAWCLMWGWQKRFQITVVRFYDIYDFFLQIIFSILFLRYRILSYQNMINLLLNSGIVFWWLTKIFFLWLSWILSHRTCWNTLRTILFFSADVWNILYRSLLWGPFHYRGIIGTVEFVFKPTTMMYSGDFSTKSILAKSVKTYEKQ